MEGLPLLRFSGGPCFLPVRTEREGGMLIRWLKGKIRSNQTEGEHKVQSETHRCVCVVCVLWAGMDGSEERDTKAPTEENQQVKMTALMVITPHTKD